MSDPEHVQLVLLNDDDHGYLYVINLLQDVCGLPPHVGLELAKRVDGTGQAVVFVGPRADAEAKLLAVQAFGPDPELVRSSGPLQAVIEPWDGESAVPTASETEVWCRESGVLAELQPPGAPPLGWSVGQAVVTGAALAFAADATAKQLTASHVALGAILTVLAAGVYLIDRDRGTASLHALGAAVVCVAGLVGFLRMTGGVG